MVHPALEALQGISREMPDLWNRYDAMREQCRAHYSWPSWCYAPVGVASCLFDQVGAANSRVTALAAWRMTKGIYRFDATLKAELVRTPLDAAVPVDVLRRLPEWCIYIELDNLSSFEGTARGAWVWLESDFEDQTDNLFLGILFDSPTGGARDEGCIYINFGGGSVLESIEATFPGDVPKPGDLAHFVQPVIALVLYICSSNAEISRGGAPARPQLPTPVRTRRRGERMFAAEAPQVWDMGVRLGAQLRAARASSEAQPAGSSGRNVTPHIRTAHWHTFVLGPRKNVPLEKRDRDVRWMPPMAIAVTDPDAMPATVHQVG